MQPIFVFQKVSDHGTSNQIVARLTLQSLEMLKWIDLTDKERNEASELLFELTRKLLRCYDCFRRLENNNRDTLEKTGAIFAGGQRALPYLKNLDDEVESFLTAAKHYLRDLVALFDIIYRSNLEKDASVLWDKNGGESAATKWARSTFDADHALPVTLHDAAAWIAELIKRRNAMEHPEGQSGTLILENYRLAGPTIAAPKWLRVGGGSAGNSSDILPDLKAYLNGLLEFGEELVIQGVAGRPRHSQIQVYEIPEVRRDPTCPKRFEISLNETLQELLETAADNSSRRL